MSALNCSQALAIGHVPMHLQGFECIQVWNGSPRCFVSCEQPGSSVMYELHIFKVLASLGCWTTKFCFCSYGSAFNKPSKWLHNKPWCLTLEGKCSCAYKGAHFTVQGTFTRDASRMFDSRCKPNALTVYGRQPTPGEAVSKFSASYPRPLCKVMAAGSQTAHARGLRPVVGPEPSAQCSPADGVEHMRPWHEDPEWVEDICESLEFKEVFRYRFRKTGHINCLECRVYKSWLKHAAKTYFRSRLICLLDSRVTMGAAAKGRSSSYSLSRILKSSLGYVLRSGLYPGALHCRSKWNRADGPSRGSEAPGPSRPIPSWFVELQRGNFKQFDQCLTVASWTRPVGRWIRLLLLCAGDIERNPGPWKEQGGSSGYVPRGHLDLLGGLSHATSERMKRCLNLFVDWAQSSLRLNIANILYSSEVANLALKGYGWELFRAGKPRYLLVYAITAIQHLRPEFRRSLAGAWQVDVKWQL